MIFNFASTFIMYYLMAAAATPESRCAELASLQMPDVTIDSVEAVTGGSFKDAAGMTYPGLPKFCRVVGHATPRPASRIGFEVWLPLEDWNGRYVQGGNGGLGGVHFSSRDRGPAAPRLCDGGHRQRPPGEPGGRKLGDRPAGEGA